MTAVLTPRRTSTRQNPFSVGGATLFMVLFAGYFLAPIWWLVTTASKTRPELRADPSLWFSGPFALPQNIADVLTYDGGRFLEWMGNSLLYAGVGGAVATLVAAMAGYALAKYAFPGREATFNIILAGVLVPTTALALPLFLLFSKLDATNTHLAVLLPSCVSPFGVYLARIYAESSVPEELLEAARLDGASELRIFFKLILPLGLPAIASLAIFQFLWVWNDLLVGLVFADTSHQPLTVAIRSQLRQFGTNFDVIAPAAFLSMLVPLVVFFAFQRYFVQGLLAGSDR
ncbi:MAG TPA: carbohydrate ABC transporter permease [Gaiellales bacterium]|nr:carbohydrate ABC transporter permease [Gaiellales bacterium]